MFLVIKCSLTDFYQQSFTNLVGIQLFKESTYAKSNYCLQTLLLDEAIERDKLLAF